MWFVGLWGVLNWPLVESSAWYSLYIFCERAACFVWDVFLDHFSHPEPIAFLFKYSAVVSSASLCFVLQLLWSGTQLTPTLFSLWMCSSSPVSPMERSRQGPALPRATEVSACMSLSPKRYDALLHKKNFTLFPILYSLSLNLSLSD